MRVATAVAAGLLLSACALENAPERTFHIPSASATATAVRSSGASATEATPPPEQTKPFVVTQQPLPPPTYARWAIDGGAPGSERSLFVLFYDSPATGFRLIDANGTVVLQVSIAGSGIFGPDTCVSSAQRPREVVTWAGLDAAAYARIVANIGTYRLEADTVAGPTVTVPLTDTGCRRP